MTGVVPPPLTGMTLTELTRLCVRAAGGEQVGRVADVGIHSPTTAPAVEYLRVRRKRSPLVLPWRTVVARSTGESELRLLIRADELDPFRIDRAAGNQEPEGARLWLCRDVLDSQVVDLSGSRLSRVSEIYLLGQPDGTLVVTAVDLGLGSLLSRIGMGRIGRRLPQVAVAWDDLYLASSAGHRIELSASTQRLHHRDPSTVAEIIARLRTEHATDVLRAVNPTHAATALAASHDSVRRGLLRSLSGEEDRTNRRFLRTTGWRVLRPKDTRR